MASIAPKSSAVGQRPRLKASIVEHGLSLMVMAGVLAAIVVGWLNRGDDWLDPEHGLGYALGIIGGSMMLVLLGYPIRKRLRGPRRSMGSVGFWFRFHMLLGLLGPLAILYHSRFSWGALNSAVALGAMLIVAGSGLIGRFLYSRVHRGYSGRKLELRSLKGEMDELLATLAESGSGHAGSWTALRDFEDRAVAAGAGFWSSAAAIAGLGLETRRAERHLRRDLAGFAGDERQHRRMRALLGDYFQAVRRAAEFAFYDRLLRLWHLLHLPLFILLVATAVLHIVAVHMY